MPCPKALEELSAYVDGELESEAELSLQRHLDSCTSCQHKVKILFALKETVVRSADFLPIPHTLREQVGPHPRPFPWLGLRRPGGGKAVLALVLILAITSMARWLWRQGEEEKYEEIAQVLVADHIHYLQVPDALEISSSDPAEVAAWFQDKVPFPVRIPLLNRARLLGGRLCLLLGQQVALVFYEQGGKRLSLFTLATAAIPPEEQTLAVNRDHPQCLRTFGKYALCLMRSEEVVQAVVMEGPEVEDLALDLFRSF